MFEYGWHRLACRFSRGMQNRFRLIEGRQSMSLSPVEIEDAQKAFCRQQSATYLASPVSSKLGFALRTRGAVPMNGLRHPPQGDTNGWYLWCGEQYSDAAEFFEPL